MHPPVAKVLRLGVIHKGMIIEERLLAPGAAVTVGNHAKNSLVTMNSPLPGRRFRLIAPDHKGGYTLRFTERIGGKLATSKGIRSFRGLVREGQTKRTGGVRSIKLTPRSRGKIHVGEFTLLFQFVPAPPRPRR